MVGNSNSNSVARDLFVYTRTVAKAGNVNTTLTIAIWAGTGSGCQHRAAPSIAACCPESSVFTGV